MRSTGSLKYHEATKHSEVSLRTSGHYLDWTRKPSPFKIYRNLPSILLPRDFPRPESSALESISGDVPQRVQKEPDIRVLAELLFFSAGLTRKTRFGSEEYFMRAAPATGALYPIELYVATRDIPGLHAGVYHYNPLDFALVQLREGDYRSHLSYISHKSCAKSPFTIVMSSLAWRNAWKYEARSYRHWFWDSGVIAANLLAACASECLPTKLILGFVDNKMDVLLGLEELRETTVCIIAIGHDPEASASPKHQGIPRLRLKIESLSAEEEVDYPIIWETNKASELVGREQVQKWTSSFEPSKEKAPVGSSIELRPVTNESPKRLGDVILRRGSSRRFSQEPISFEALSLILKASKAPIPFDFLPDGESAINFYFIANEVDGLPSGSYYYNRWEDSLEELKLGRFRSMSGYLSLGQTLFSQASAMFFLTANLNRLLTSLGDRGYRAAQLEAGIRAGKIYLSSYALGLGASGSTFYDDAVTEFFSPHAKEESPMIAVGVGVPGYHAHSGRILPQFSKQAH